VRSIDFTFRHDSENSTSESGRKTLETWTETAGFVMRSMAFFASSRNWLSPFRELGHQPAIGDQRFRVVGQALRPSVVEDDPRVPAAPASGRT